MSPLRSSSWFGAEGKVGFHHRSWLKNQGHPNDLFEGRPVIGIANSWSELTPCNAHLRDVADYVKRGVWEAGGFPLEFPTMSLGETLMRPTTMLYRNLLAMEAEESIRANPLDGVVLLSGCDKTTPGLLMGALSVDLPTIMVTGGPMLNGKFRGEDVGSGTHVWSFTEEVRAGSMAPDDLIEAEGCMSRSAGHCMTMGTASTMACLVEAMGLQLSGGAAIPAVDSRRYRMAQLTGRRIVEMVNEELRPSTILTRQSFENAIIVSAAIGGSTNAVVHLLALAGRARISLELDDFDKLGQGIPLLVDLLPAGRKLMEDFYYAGGLPAVIRELGDRIHGDALTVSGQTLGQVTDSASNWNPGVIRNLDDPVKEKGGIAVLQGSLAPDGAVIKVAAASEHLMEHRGRAVVFESTEDMEERIDDPNLEIDETSVLVLRNCGPHGYPGMPEVGNLILPTHLLQKGVRDMVRITDGRMSGTSYGTVVLHVSPEAAVGGPLSLVRTGDEIELNVNEGRLDLLVSADELAERSRIEVSIPQDEERGWTWLYRQHVDSASKGADLDFLVGGSGHGVGRVPF